MKNETIRDLLDELAAAYLMDDGAAVQKCEKKIIAFLQRSEKQLSKIIYGVFPSMKPMVVKAIVSAILKGDTP